MMMPLLQVTALSYHNQERPLLNNVSFELYGGQKVVLVGRSGSGKSLLLQALADLLELDVVMNDRIMLNKNGILTPLSQISPNEYRADVALFHQTPQLTGNTVQDALMMPFGFKHHCHRTFEPDWHLGKLKTLGKSERFLGRSLHELSGGERQLVNLLRTLQLDPLIALFDEPTSALDEETAEAVMTLVKGWHDDNKAMIWVTHAPSQAHALKADVWRMTDGVLNTAESHHDHHAHA